MQRACATPAGRERLVALHSYALRVTDLPADRMREVLEKILPPGEAMKIVTTAEKLEAKGRIEKIRDILLRQMTRRFATVPESVAQRIRTAALDDLDRWLDRVLDARSLDELLA
jgi:hypothetical protein